MFLEHITSKTKKMDICNEIDKTLSGLDKMSYHRKSKDVFDAPFSWKRDNMYVIKIKNYMFSYDVAYINDEIIISIEEVAKNGYIITENKTSINTQLLYESIIRDVAKIVKKAIINQDK